MALHLFLFALSAASVAQSRTETSSLSTPALCNFRELNTIFNPVCYESRNPSDFLDLQCLQDGLCVHSSQNQAQQPSLPINITHDHLGWSYKPRCIQQKVSGQDFCAYTSNGFARGRGISIFTTPEEIEKLLELPAFTDNSLYKDIGEQSNPPYVAMELPGRGIGLVANRTLNRGDHVFSEPPVYLLNEDVFRTFSVEERVRVQRTAIKRLPPKTKSDYMALHGHFGGDHVEDVINTNAFTIAPWGTPDGAEYDGVFPLISRLNHDCRPNAHHHFNVATLTHHVYALRTIHPGEELTISYIHGAEPRAARQAHISGAWGFACGCSACGRPDAEAAASDSRVTQIKALHAVLEDYGAGGAATPAMAERLVELYRLERLEAPLAKAYALAAVEHAGVGDEEEARRYARLAIEAGLLFGGPEYVEASGMSEMLDDPRSHWSWMLRLKNR